ncbi:unnamed protein product [Clonostachys rosea f. rosea IK726]|jgi:hypothetical protein|uniref:Succinate dehydrogenase assembly factor 4, mitochondrial n=2 Tax=Bionectria ochroleuca TaxID=29856 RepID=A0A0B7JP07_BIOOC|nr:unnamed protein product [Clonostachys rosea f. rosea IK726]
MSRILLARGAPRSLPRVLSTRSYSSSPFSSQPGPPKLPANEQAEFERLQRQAAVSPAFQPETLEAEKSAAAAKAVDPAAEELGEGGLWRGAKPEFDGEVNPKTGEVGGPKNEPLRWGDKSDWSYNGRVTDF